MAGNNTVYTSAGAGFVDGSHDWDDDDFYAILVTSNYTPLLSHSTYADVSTDEVSGGSYAAVQLAGKQVVTVGDTVECRAQDALFPAGTYTAKYIVILKGSATSKNSTDPLICYGVLADPGSYSVTSKALVVGWQTQGVFRLAPCDTVTPGSVETGGGGVLDPNVLLTADTQLFIAPQSSFPYIRDYADTVPDTAFTTATGLPDRARRGMYGGYLTRDVTDLGTYPALQILSDLTLRAMWRMLVETGASLDIVDYGAGGVSEATNSLWNYNIISQNPSFFAESGAGVNRDARWLLPGGMPADLEFLVEFQRDASGDVRCWVNGTRLLVFSSVDGVTDNGDGSAGSFTATGGGSSQLGAFGIGDNIEIDLYFVQVEDVEAGAAAAEAFVQTVAADWTADQNVFLFRDDHDTIGGQADCLLCLKPTASTIEDTAGTLDSGTDWATVGSVQQVFDVSTGYWLEGGDGWESVALSALANTGTQSVQFLLMYLGSGTNQISFGNWVGSDTEPNNFLWLFSISGGAISMFYEYGAGTNTTVSWTISPSIAVGDVIEFKMNRTDNGDGTCDIQMWFRQCPDPTWSLLTVSNDGTGTGSGTTTISGATNPSGGTNGTVALNRANQDIWIKQLIVRDTASTPT